MRDSAHEQQLTVMRQSLTASKVPCLSPHCALNVKRMRNRLSLSGPLWQSGSHVHSVQNAGKEANILVHSC